MAQLSDDCFAFGGPLLTVAEVLQFIQQRVAPVPETQTVGVDVASGRVLADDVHAPVALPPFDNSAVDGYGVRYCDLAVQGESRLPIASQVFAGSPALAPLAPGTAARIFTGAPMPKGADTVFMQEDCRVEGDVVVLPAGLKQGANRRLRGEDVQEQAIVLKAGTVLGPQHLAIASAVGLTHLQTRRRLKLALFSTGNEIVEPGQPLQAAALYDANRTLLKALAQAIGVSVTDLGILADEPTVLAEALRAAAMDHDLVLTSGGVSTGDADYVRTAVEQVGSLTFWRTAIKPGRPVAMGVLKGANGNTAAFCGLPGNPVAAFVTFARIVRPLLMQLAGAQPVEPIAFPVRAGFAYKKKAGRREYVRVSLTRTSDGRLEAHKYKQDGAGVISSLTATDGLVELPEDCKSIAVGDPVGFMSYAALIGG